MPAIKHEPKIENHEPPVDTKPVAGRAHRATYATDKRKGGYLIRVVGPNAARFKGRVVPVTLKDGKEGKETLSKLLWSGLDLTSGETVALYEFLAKPRDAVNDEIPF